MEPRKKSKGRHARRAVKQVSGGHLFSPWEIPYASGCIREDVDGCAFHNNSETLYLKCTLIINKVDSFDTRVSETIDLILFEKCL